MTSESMQLIPEPSRIAELEADNQRLRRLLEQRDAPAELRHRLRGTMALLRVLIRRSAEGCTDVAAYVAHLEDRLGSLMRTQAYIDQNGEVDLDVMIADEMSTYLTHEDRRLRLTGPGVSFKPKAGQAMGLAIHELAMNAVEHGALAHDGRVEIAWHVTEDGPEPRFGLEWKESANTAIDKPSLSGFGTEVLMAMIPHDLGAETKLDYEPDGLRVTIRFPLLPWIGRLSDPAEPGDEAVA